MRDFRKELEKLDATITNETKRIMSYFKKIEILSSLSIGESGGIKYIEIGETGNIMLKETKKGLICAYFMFISTEKKIAIFEAIAFSVIEIVENHPVTIKYLSNSTSVAQENLLAMIHSDPSTALGLLGLEPSDFKEFR